MTEILMIECHDNSVHFIHSSHTVINQQALVAIFEIRSRASRKPSIVFCRSPVQIKIHEFICTILFVPKYDPRLTSMNLPPDWNLDNQIWDLG